MKAVDLYYFSGTGNTLRVMKAVERHFVQKGYTVGSQVMKKNAIVELKEDHLIGLIFPVAIQSTFPLVWAFVENLPMAKDQAIFMMDTMESFFRGVVGPMKRLLTGKGYRCIGAKEIKMATSMQTTLQKAEAGKLKNDAAEAQVIQFVEDLIEGRAVWRSLPIVSDWMRAISKDRSIWTKMSEKLSVDIGQCVGCRLCERHCPMEAISYESGQIRINHDKCMACMRCINYCPTNAIRLNGKTLYQKKKCARQLVGSISLDFEY